MRAPQGSGGAFAFGLEDDRWPVKKMPWLVGSCMAGVPDLDSVYRDDWWCVFIHAEKRTCKPFFLEGSNNIFVIFPAGQHKKYKITLVLKALSKKDGDFLAKMKPVVHG